MGGEDPLVGPIRPPKTSSAFIGIMEADFQPSIMPFLSLSRHLDPPTFQLHLSEYLLNHRGKFPQIMDEFAVPHSPTFNHLCSAFFASCPPAQGGSDIERKGFFNKRVIQPFTAAMLVGRLEAAEKIGAQTLGGESFSAQNKKPDIPLPPKLIEPVRPAPPPPRRVVFSSLGVENRPKNSPVNRSANTLYISNLEEGVNTNMKMLTKSLEELGFPQELLEEADKLSLRPLPEKNKAGERRKPACFLEGPPSNPKWAEQMLAAKGESRIRYSLIHMAMADPKPRQPESPGRDRKVKEVTARLQRISLGDRSPMLSSPSSPTASPPGGNMSEMKDSSGGGGDVPAGAPITRKRGLGGEVEGKQNLFPSTDSMIISSPNPGAAKLHNWRETPRWRKKDVTKDDMQLGTPLPKSALGRVKPSSDAPKEGEEEGVKKEGEEGGATKGSEDGINLDDALPISPPKTGENAQQKEEGEGIPN